MDEIRSEKEEKGKRRRKAICRKTGDHVHYPPTRLTKPTRPPHAPSPNLKSSFRFPDKKPRYGKCRKNQAAGLGTTAYDGCGEFVSSISGEDCAACGCHRNFHREEEESILERCIRSGTVDESVLEMLKISEYQFRQIFCSPYGDRRRSKGEEDLVEEERVKRLKTKFTAEQTEKMRSYAEKLRWKVSPENRDEVDEFCVEIGVNPKNFRVWMNNHKDKN
ncbi:unnamed protein product [Arabis nemorensis]|uniref:ZF-HD dimerization-type domain-containing protein n=1 Tax=Arabis nemorensis TaxID=586526 RepID=A0A565C1T7_9BRAS|nr:unnamed protein product [Arabis nemorensis]